MKTPAFADGNASCQDKKMKKYTVEMTIKGLSKVHWSKVHDKSSEEIDADIEEGIDEGYADEVIVDLIDSNDNNWDLIINDEEFVDNNDTFTIEVKDEDGNVVFKSNDPESVFHDDDDDDDNIPVSADRYPGDGTYLIELEMLKWYSLTGTFETEDFQPSKFHLDFNGELEYIMNMDNVDFKKLRYGLQYINLEEQEDYDTSGTVFYKAELANRRCEIEEIEY
jgi:hypothetical protein